MTSERLDSLLLPEIPQLDRGITTACHHEVGVLLAGPCFKELHFSHVSAELVHFLHLVELPAIDGSRQSSGVNAVRLLRETEASDV